MTPIEEAALHLKAWAAKKGILTYEPREELEEYESRLADATDAVNIESAEQVFQNRRINFIGVDDQNNKIIIRDYPLDVRSPDTHIEGIGGYEDGQSPNRPGFFHQILD